MEETTSTPDINLEAAQEAPETQEQTNGLNCRRSVLYGPTAMGLTVGSLAVLFFLSHTDLISGAKHKPLRIGVATDVHIVDDNDAHNDGQKEMIKALAGNAPFLRKWFGNPNSKAVHHDGGDLNISKKTVAGRYEPQLQRDGCYQVHEWHPAGPRAHMTLSASLELTHAHGVARKLVDQSSQGGQWNFVGAFDLKKGTAKVTLSNFQSRCIDASPCYTTFDAFRFAYIAPNCDSQGEHADTISDHKFVFGNVLLSTPDVPSFIEDASVAKAVKHAISTLVGVPSSAVSVVFSPGKAKLPLAVVSTPSVIVSFRISTSSIQQTSTVAADLESKTTEEIGASFSQAFFSAGFFHKLQVHGLWATLDEEEEATLENSDEVQEATLETSPLSSGSEEPSCMPSVIINDFDSDLVKSSVSAGARDLPGQGLEAFRPGRVAEKPYFSDWFGNIAKKDFHHDAHINKGLVKVNYSTPLSEAGCYLLQEWHLGGSKYCVNYMPRRVPFHVHSTSGMQMAYADQSVNGGQWNSLGLFQFGTSASIVMSNEGTDNCLYRGNCYTIFDSLRLVRVGRECMDADHGNDFIDRMSDLACDAPQSLAQLGHALSQNDNEPSSSGLSPVRLVEILSPSEKSTVDAGCPGRTMKVSWRTEGVANDTDVRISLFYKSERVTSMIYRMTSDSGEALLQMPPARHIRYHSSVLQGGNQWFRIRIDVQHVQVEFNNGWSDQLYAYSPYFTLKV